MIERVKFGTTKEGTEASIYILENGNGMHVQVSDFGAYVGRNANRIKNACVVIGGKKYRLDKE